MSPKIVDKDEKRKRISLAAVEVFGSSGFDRTRMEDVAKKAGVGKGTIYEYFKNKDELITGSFWALMTEMMVDVFEWPPDPSKTATALLTELSNGMIKAIGKLGDTYRFFLEYMLYASRRSDGFGDFSDMLTQWRQIVTAVIDKGKAEGEFRTDIDSAEVSAAISAWFDGAILHWIVLPDTISLEQMGQGFLDITFEGLNAAKTGGAR